MSWADNPKLVREARNIASARVGMRQISAAVTAAMTPLLDAAARFLSAGSRPPEGRTMSKGKCTLERDVINAAREYIREVENPAPDLLHRARLRERLSHAVAVLDGRTPPARSTGEGE